MSSEVFAHCTKQAFQGYFEAPFNIIEKPRKVKNEEEIICPSGALIIF